MSQMTQNQKLLLFAAVFAGLLWTVFWAWVWWMAFRLLRWAYLDRKQVARVAYLERRQARQLPPNWSTGGGNG